MGELLAKVSGACRGKLNTPAHKPINYALTWSIYGVKSKGSNGIAPWPNSCKEEMEEEAKGCE